VKLSFQCVVVRLSITAFAVCAACGFAAAQVPAPVIDTTATIVVKAITSAHHPSTKLPKFEGTFVNATTAQVTVRAKDNELDLQTFSLSPEVSQKMQTIIDKGGFQYGDKITVFYDSTTHQALKIKGKPSKPI
jgi:hypothetical protein